MHICVVAGTFHPEPGGPPTYLYHLLPALVQRGHTVTVVTYTDAHFDTHDDTTYGYPVHRITRHQPIPLRLLNLTRAVLRHGRQADVLFISDYGLPAALANLLLRKPMVTKNVSDFAWEFSTRHGWLPPGETIDAFQQRRHRWRVRLLQAVQRAYIDAATLIIAPSRYSASLVTGWGVSPHKLRVVYNALDLSAFADLPDKTEARTVLGLPPAAPVAVAVARFSPWKHLDDVARAVIKARGTVPDLRLVLVGDGPARPIIAQAAAPLGDAVTFTGQLPPDAVYRYLRAADVYVQFSTYEGLPHTVLEAMAAGTPCITSAVGGNLEVIVHGETGMLVTPQDVDGLAAAIVTLITRPDDAVRLAANATTQLHRFSWPVLVDATEAVLNEARP